MLVRLVNSLFLILRLKRRVATGAFSRGLCQYVKSIVGVDISQNAVDEYNRRVTNQGLLPEEMKAVCATLKGTDDELDGMKFDVVAVNTVFAPYAITPVF